MVLVYVKRKMKCGALGLVAARKDGCYDYYAPRYFS